MKERKSNTILILGDSTSMSIGVERTMHPFLSSSKNIWPDNTKIVNSSLPGMTAADAVTFFFRHKRELLKDLRAVLIYLGNCDTTSSEVTKGRFGKLKQIKFNLQEITGKHPVKTSIKNRLLHFEWNNSFNPHIESPESPEDYEYNLSLVINDCKANSIPVILVRPKANLFFPSGIGKGNFIFYRYFGIKDKISDNIIITDKRFKQALKLHESGEFKLAEAAYNEILLKAPISPMSQEYSLLVLNNYAIAKAEEGEYDDALYLLKLLLKESGVRKEIILFNIAYIKKRISSNEEFLQALHESYEADSSLYRIRAPYITAIDRIAAKNPSVRLIDMHAIIADRFYLDHCHPLLEGQSILSDNICKALSELGIHGTNTAKIENILYNPELANGNISEFNDYFKTFAPYSEKEIEQQIADFKKISSGAKTHDAFIPELNSLTKELKTAIEYYFRHPCFTSISDILHFPPIYPSDIGRFPEFFIIRHLIPYLRILESDDRLSSKFDKEVCLLRSSGQLLSILPEKSKCLVAKSPFIDPLYDATRVPIILNKVRSMLINHLTIGSQIFERTKGTIFWYVRETLRFGSHSRYSMRYDRLLLEFLAEGLAVACVLDQFLDQKQSKEIDLLIRVLYQTVAVHEEFCRKLSLNEASDKLLLDYDLKLKERLLFLTKK